MQQAALKNNGTYLLQMEITKRPLNNRIYQHCGVKTSTVTPSLYYSSCPVTTAYQVSSEICGGFFY